jgi:hypothetical protein
MTLTKTKYVKSIKPPTTNMLKPGSNNKKLGWNITSKKWQGAKLYSLTLEERASCPTSCEQWDNCYGNNMPFAHRFKHTHPDFLTQLEANVDAVCAKHPGGVVIRLHVLGDFFSIAYVRFWARMLDKHQNLYLFGYTHHKHGTNVGAWISLLTATYIKRCVIRFSDDPVMDLSAQTIKPDSPKQRGIICPEQLGMADSCADCGLCWTALNKPILFLEH